MKKNASIVIALLFVFVSGKLFSQGCVAIRSTGSCGIHHADSSMKSGSWELGMNNRYFKSYKHFVGTEEQKQRVEEGTEVINHAYVLDLLLTKRLNNRWSLSLDVPIVSNARSSLYEHDRKNRNSTHSFGIGDVRFTAYAWLLDPVKSYRGNVQVGLGIKLPTGDYKVQDYFHNTDTSTILGPVDQSIQLGDGGTGFTLEINAYYNFSPTVGVYGNFYYLLNPREYNGVSSARGGIPSTNAIKYNTDIMSVPDQHLFRAGVNVNAGSFTFSGGFRYERLNAKDLIGGSRGFRRPGYIMSAEPGINYKLGKVTLYTYVPVALKRDRIQSNSDIRRSADTKTHVQGDAAFADYAVNIGASIRF